MCPRISVSVLICGQHSPRSSPRSLSRETGAVPDQLLNRHAGEPVEGKRDLVCGQRSPRSAPRSLSRETGAVSDQLDEGRHIMCRQCSSAYSVAVILNLKSRKGGNRETLGYDYLTYVY